MTQTTRQADYPIDPSFLERWSPRALNAEPIPVETLMSFFEAARWAPSSYNSQPWRFVYALHGTPAFDRFVGILTGANPTWCKDASALVLIVSSETMMVPKKDEPVPSYSHSFDAGAAWMAMALQATKAGWFTHGMVGLNYAAAAEVMKVPTGFRVEAAIAIGRPGDKSKLPDFFQAVEAPNGRRPLSETVHEGSFPA